MKTVIWSFLLCVLFSATAAAQPGPPEGEHGGRPPSPEDRVERLSEDLNLDEKQSARLLEIFTAADAEREALRNEHQQQIRQDVCALHKSASEQVKSVLTEQQSAEFDRLTAQMKDRRGRHHQRRGKDRWPGMHCEESGS